MSAIIASLLLLGVGQAPFLPPPQLYVSYDFSETRRTESEHRESTTQIFLTAHDYVGYRYQEYVFGSTNPTVRSVEFSNENARKATAKEQAELVEALLAAKVFELVSELTTASTGSFSRLDVRINTNEAKTYFCSPPRSPGGKAVHDIMLEFAKRTGVDRPADPAKATMITEGDLQPARVVKLAEVLAHPDEYHGKRISVIGFYHGEFEHSSFSVDQISSKRDYQHSLWRSGISTFAEKSAVNDRNDSWLRIDGIFLRGPCGHMGLWPGEIVRLTRVEPVSQPN